MNLDDLDLRSLKKLQVEVQEAIDSLQVRRKNEALAAVEEKAKSMGFSLSELIDAKGINKKKPPVAPKYAHPENGELNWSGRGRKPRWLVDYLSAGKSLDDLKI